MIGASPCFMILLHQKYLAAAALLTRWLQEYADTARQLVQLFAQHPQLESQVQDDKTLARWKSQFLSAMGRTYTYTRVPMLDTWKGWMSNLLWNVVISKLWPLVRTCYNVCLIVGAVHVIQVPASDHTCAGNAHAVVDVKPQCALRRATGIKRPVAVAGSVLLTSRHNAHLKA
jgi:hypothetical protein